MKAKPPPPQSPTPAEAYGLYRPKVAFEIFERLPFIIQGAPRVEFPRRKVECIIARVPFRAGSQPTPILVVILENDQLFCTGGITNLQAEDFECTGDASRLMSVAVIRAAFKSSLKTDKHFVSLGRDAYPTLKYLCAGGSLKGKLPEFDAIDVQIIEHWPRWQRTNLSMKERAAEVFDKKGVPLNDNRFRTRCLRLELQPHIRAQKRSLTTGS